MTPGCGSIRSGIPPRIDRQSAFAAGRSPASPGLIARLAPRRTPHRSPCVPSDPERRLRTPPRSSAGVTQPAGAAVCHATRTSSRVPSICHSPPQTGRTRAEIPSMSRTGRSRPSLSSRPRQSQMSKIPISSRVPRRPPSWLSAPARTVRFAVENALGRRVIAWMLLCSLGLALVSTAGQLYVNYHRDVAQIERRLGEIERSSTSALTSAVWNLDQAQLKAQLVDNGAVLDMSSATFVDAHGKTMAEAGDAATGAITRIIPIYSPDERAGSRVELGKLTIRASLSGAHDNLRGNAILTLISKGGETLLVSFMMLLIFRGLVSRPLSDLARSAT